MADFYDPESSPNQWNYLQSGTIIDEYIIERMLAQGGFSIVYLARQLKNQYQVAIKEYLPQKLAHRSWNNRVVAHDKASEVQLTSGKRLFFEEAKVLAELKHPAIVSVINFFNANDTVYLVMAYDYGVTLDKILQKKSLPITEGFLLTVFGQLLEGVAAMHSRQMLHLDIKPANILIRAQHAPLLLDFGAIHRLNDAASAGRAKVVSNGFSPIEQCRSGQLLGAWSDIYAIGASMRACLDGKTPPTSLERIPVDPLPPATQLHKRHFSAALLRAIDWAMAPQAADRPQSVQALQAALATVTP